MNGPDSESASFGSFQLFPSARAIEKDGVPLALGNRALDILIVLVEHAGEVVSHKELLSRVWRGLVVDPGNLRVHMTGLRKALGDDAGRSRYIANVPGQGYCFVAPIRRETSAGPAAQLPNYPCGAARKRLVLPPVLSRMVGREVTVRTISADLIADRFVTLIGPGGMGKTTVAVCVAHAMVEEFADAVCFVDIGAVSDSKLVAATIASSLGLTIPTDNVVPTLLECLQTLRILLVLDNCEHVIETAATLADLIFKETASVHILATSREALRVEGEHAFWLPPLESPPPDSSLKAVHVAAFPAVKLFMERAAASGARFELNDDNAPIVAGICGRLDGVALAIELAAGRTGSHGITGTADLLDTNLGLDWHGRRTALPRHQTLRALLDWSYDYLPEPEQIVLRRLAIFVGAFSLEAARAIACASAVDEGRLANTLDYLVSKSLVSAVILEGRATAYRLLETTRVYAAEKLRESGEASEVAERHGRYFTRLLQATFSGDIESPHDTGARDSAEHLGNVRAALGWCFADDRTLPKVVLGIELTAASVPVFLELSLLTECHHWSKVALTLLDDAARGSRREMVLLEAWAISTTWTRGNGDDMRAALTRGIELARDLGEESCRLRLLVGMHILLVRSGQFDASLAIAAELQAAARDRADGTYGILSDWMRGSSEHFTGDQAAARDHFAAGFARPGPRNMRLFGLEYRVRALVTFARVLWLSGSPDQAMETVREAIREAARESKPLDVCFSLLYTAAVTLWCGDLDATRDQLDKLMAHPNWQALPALHATGLGLRGELLLRQGETQRATVLLREALGSMRADGQNVLVARIACVLAEALAAGGRLSEALSVISDVIIRTEGAGEKLELPELLRIKATILLATSGRHSAEAEDCLVRSLECARLQSARSWELRTELTRARLRATQGREDEARQSLSSLYGRFTEGFETQDVEAARQFLAAPEPPHPRQH